MPLSASCGSARIRSNQLLAYQRRYRSYQRTFYTKSVRTVGAVFKDLYDMIRFRSMSLKISKNVGKVNQSNAACVCLAPLSPPPRFCTRVGIKCAASVKSFLGCLVFFSLSLFLTSPGLFTALLFVFCRWRPSTPGCSKPSKE